MRRVRFLALICCLSVTPMPAASQIFRDSAPPTLEIRDYPVFADNNSLSRYSFVLSVLGSELPEGFLPLLAIAGRKEATGEVHWLALWNLSETSPSVWQRFRAAAGVPGTPRGVDGADFSPDKLPEPSLSIRSLRAGAWTRVGWKFVDQAIRYSGYLVPARFFVNNYAGHGADLAERRFHQTYTLLQLYQAASQVNPSPDQLPASDIMQMKYYLLVNRRLSGLFLPREASNDIVERFESQLRAQTGNTASYLHAYANLYRLTLRQVDFGLPGRVPICRGALLSIRGDSIPAQPPKWPSHNPFDLSYNPYEKPEVQELFRRYPGEDIPLAFYVLSSEYRLKPILVADFFKRGGIRRETSHVWRITLDQALELTNIPVLYRTLGMISSYALNKKDYPRFSRRSTASGVESVRLFTRLDWSFDPDMNDLLLKALDGRRANPLADSTLREDHAAKARLESLKADGDQGLAVYLRRLFEDEVRATLKLSGRAIFDTDLDRYKEEQVRIEALRLLREFTAEANLPAQSWDRILEAWSLVRSQGGMKPAEAKRFLARLRQVEAAGIPPTYQAAVERVLKVDLAMGPTPSRPGSD